MDRLPRYIHLIYPLRRNGPDAHQVVCEAAKEGLAVCRPRDGHTLRLARVSAYVDKVGLELIHDRPGKVSDWSKRTRHDILGLKVKDLDT
jgi:hypothetical protein